MTTPLNHGPLDALIQCLESDEEVYDDDGGGGGGREGGGGGGGDGDGVVDLSVTDGDTRTQADTVSLEPSQVTEVPPAPRRVPSRTITRYLSSPHARRERVKQSPCMFCPEHKDVLTLRDHLEASVLCRTNYYSLLKVNSIDGIMLKTYVCMFCQDAGSTLKTHLRSSNVCFQSFRERFNVDTIE